MWTESESVLYSESYNKPHHTFFWSYPNAKTLYKTGPTQYWVKTCPADVQKVSKIYSVLIFYLCISCRKKLSLKLVKEAEHAERYKFQKYNWTLVAMGTVQNLSKLISSSRVEKKGLRSTIVGRVLQEEFVSENIQNEVRINRFHVSHVVEENIFEQIEDKDGTEHKLGKVRKENLRGTREHLSKVETGQDFRLKKFQVCNVSAVVEMEGEKKLDARSHQQLTTNGQVSSVHRPTIRSLPVQGRRMVRWWDGYTPDSNSSDRSTCCLNISKADSSQVSPAESNLGSTSTVRAGSQLAKVLAAKMGSWKGGCVPLTL